MTVITDINPADEAMLDAFWSTKPIRPAKKELPQIPLGSQTCSITCRACGKRDIIAINWDGLLCGRCRVDLLATKQRQEEALAELPALEAAAGEAWVKIQEQLDDATANRLSLMLADRDRAYAVWQRASRRGNVKNNEQDPAEAESQARAAYDAVLAKIERTIAKYPEMRPLFEAEAEYRKAVESLKVLRIRFEIALQEIDAAEGHGLPF